MILVLVAGIGFVQDFDYGYQKAIQYSAPQVYALILVGLLFPWQNHGTKVRQKAFAGLSIITAIVLGASFAGQVFAAHEVASRKKIPSSISRVEDIIDGQRATASLLILDGSFEEPFFYSAWLPYSLRNLVTILPESSDQIRWYHQPWSSTVSEERTPRYVLTASSPRNQLFAIRSKALHVDDTVALYPNGLGMIALRGIGPRHGHVCRLVGDRLEVRLSEGYDWTLRLGLQGGGPKVHEVENLRVLVNGGEESLRLTGGRGSLEINLSGMEGNEIVVILPQEEEVDERTYL